MTDEEIKCTQEAKVISLAANTWNEFLKLEPNDNDKLIVMECVHRIQDLMFASLFIKEHGTL